MANLSDAGERNFYALWMRSFSADIATVPVRLVLGLHAALATLRGDEIQTVGARQSDMELPCSLLA
ncbi:hypothetical protein [Paeniglutamicibacter kerguelensis]|uniref:Uncharacterized protein n=1 Tax=Paeniglutamicibacter kerguelensis TaxID=254788 RepID=A0ABS4XB53_9MICC|nr:hypothetical protein [Paeniglutamicibacter kerguelensis]MBP2385606.1 hypothetical protein [Paeniglutamicibacter kerguelensis]